MGDIVTGRATKHKEKYHNFKSKVIAIQAQHYKVEILEGPAKGENHRYVHASVTVVKGALPQAAPDGAVAVVAEEPTDTLPATIGDDRGDPLADVFGTATFN